MYNNLCQCLLLKPNSKPDRIKELAEVSYSYRKYSLQKYFSYCPQIVLELDKENEKAWYRHGQACLRLRDFHTAKTSFMKVQSLSGGVLCVYIVYISLGSIVTVSGKNKDLARFLAECEAELGKSRQRESEMYQAMFKLQTGTE